MEFRHGKSKNIIFKVSLLVSFVKLFVKLFSLFRKKELKKNMREFLHAEEEELGKFLEHKESAKEVASESFSIFKDYFISHEGNDHKPKLLRTKPLLIVTILLISFKIFIAAYLFLIFPSAAKMSEVISVGVLNLINKERSLEGLNELKLDIALSNSALAKAADMLENDYFAHDSLDGKKPWDWVDKGEYAYLLIGENLAMGFNSAEQVHEALMTSPIHKRNILNSKYSDVGIAVVDGVINGQKSNVLVQHFGFRKNLNLNEEIERSVDGLEEKKIVRENNVEKLEPVLVKNKRRIRSKLKEDESKEPAVLGVEDNLNNSPLLISVSTKKYKRSTFLLNTSKMIYYTFLLFITLALLLNIFVKSGVQHRRLIYESLFVLSVIVGLISSHVHYLERAISMVLVV